MAYTSHSGTTTPGLAVHVYFSGTSTAVPIFSDAGVTPKGNPFVANITTGAWTFYADSSFLVYEVFGVAPPPTPVTGGGGTTYILVDGGGDSESNEFFSGAPGTQGSPGSPGNQGPTGPAGFGFPGADGEDGLDGFPGTQGPSGATGIQGAQGPAGRGVPGMDGDDGDSGIPGPMGPAGATGPAGSTGSNGQPGPPGADGEGADSDWVYPPGVIGVVARPWILVATSSLAGLANWDVKDLGGYSDIRVMVKQVTFALANEATLKVSTDNGATFLGSSGDYVGIQGDGTEVVKSFLEYYSASATTAKSGEVHITGFNVAGGPKMGHSTFFSSDATMTRYIATSSALNAVRVVPQTGVNFLAGTGYVWGRV